MKNTSWLFVAFLIAAVSLLAACTSHEGAGSKVADKSSLYTCPMHPQVLEHSPGNCPICGMKLVEKNAAPVALHNIDLEMLLKPTNEFVVASLPVAVAQTQSVSMPVTVYGTIEADTRAAGSVSARVSGRIEKLYVRYRFQKVAAGQKVADIYSPELLTAQENLLFLLKNDAQNTSFINAARQKLLLLGMSATELNKVARTGKPLYRVGIYSSYSGRVHDAGNDQMNAAGMTAAPVTQELSLRDGMYLEKGQTLFTVTNHKKAWAALQIFPNQQGSIKKNDRVQIRAQTDTTAVVNGTIDFVEPFFRGDSKTLTARVYFTNDQLLPIGSQVTANVFTATKSGLWIPQTAVLALGQNNVAFLKADGGFVAHKIATGVRANDKVQVIAGLNAGDTVAANAQYLIDSEGFIKTASR